MFMYMPNYSLFVLSYAFNAWCHINTTMLYMSSCMGMGFLYSHKAMPSYVGPLGLVVFPVSSCMHCHEVITYKQKHLCFV